MNLIFKLIGSIILSFETCWKTKTFIKALTVIGYLFPCSPQQVALVRSWSTKFSCNIIFLPAILSSKRECWGNHACCGVQYCP
jgi:hypothetical protein